jgi:FtsH-binding integral membrane protein
LVEYILLFNIPEEYIIAMVSQNFAWLFILGLFWLGSTLANKWTLSQSKNVQYLGLAFYVLLEAIIFLPMIYLAVVYTESIEVLKQAALLTLALFGGLTAVAFLSNKDFSFLKNVIVIGGFVSLGLIVIAILFGFNLGLWFSLGMVLLASASILYETQKLKDVYSPNQYVGASLQLFASIMLLFWYILRILSSRK